MTPETTGLVEIVRRSLRRAGALEPGVTCLVAASGGRDSMVLLDLCLEIGRSEGAFVAATVDHGLRAFEAEAGILERFCEAHGFPWRLASLEPELRTRARELGRSLEDQARRERYAALEGLADTLGGTRILTAHTAEDQAETILLRLLRGTGPMGLAGILRARGRLLRPMLEASRAAVAAYADARRLPWIRDPGNEDENVRRCRLRALLPDLEAAFPGAVAVLARDASVAADHAAGLRVWALEHFGLAAEASLPLELPLDRVGQGQAAQVRLHGLLRALGLADRLERSHLEILVDIAAGVDGRSADLPGGLVASRRGERLHLGVAVKSPPSEPIEIPGPGRHATALGILEITEETPGAATTDPRVEVFFDRGALRLPLLLRPPRPGERVEPFGMDGHTRLVSDLLSEERIPRHLRAEPRILEDADEQVMWIVGCRRGTVAPVDGSTASVLRVRLT